MLSQEQIEQFLYEGFVRIDNAFPASTAEEVRKILWKETGCDPNDPTTWAKPVIRLGMYHQKSFIDAANTEVLHQAFDQLAGSGQWLPVRSMGTFPVRFPSPEDPGDAGWHVDAGFPGNDPGNYFEWRINIRSKGRALLMLFLFSDVSENDAPTRIRTGSHLDVAGILEPLGEWGLSFMELATRLTGLPERPEVLATGKAGTVYLCHPFLVHAAQPHRGQEPRFMAQPPLLLKDELMIDSPVEKAIQFAISK
ncbi:phytanoyl-CoA dioxygenase family protein [Niastella caeni]|uniref:Phytanoyl-CoA dioxygenase family protein n=1 Tax=Niastella caeni TaxID=2569763 RepID=A0A4S8HYK7_9BACT|nr:phytanoyl-CoA dioxygenase family protein [Niastella caeni]THU38322.1 phytanoyl-CoA dioxygenase family protein [Niastella caeni]